MKSLQHTLEGLLDQDFDIDVITLEELIDMVYTQRNTKKLWDKIMKAVDVSFEPANESDCAQDYFGTIELFPKYREMTIRFEPSNERARGFGARRNILEIKKKRIKCDHDGCHWLMKPAYKIPETQENQNLLDEIYDRHK